MLEDLLQIDRQVFVYLNNLGSPGWDGLWMFITNKWSSIPLYILLLILVYRSFGLKKTLLLLVSIALLITVSDQLSNFFKIGVGRLRPCYDPDLSELIRLVKASCGGKYGYFSAHASNSFAIAVFFAHLFRKSYKILVWILVIWALVVAYSRIYVGVHFPLDILSGALAGTFMGWLFYRLFMLTLRRISL